MLTLVSIITIIVVVSLFALQLFAKKTRYIISGLALMAIGGLHIAYEYRFIEFNLYEFALVQYVVSVFIVFAGRDLFVEAFKESKSILKIPSLIFALMILIITTIPTLNRLGVISFSLPEYHPLIDSLIYVLAGLFLLIGRFTLLMTED